jgi:hypothetical protein
LRRSNTDGVYATFDSSNWKFPPSDGLGVLLPFVFAASSGYCYLKPPALPGVHDFISTKPIAFIHVKKLRACTLDVVSQGALRQDPRYTSVTTCNHEPIKI